jgi:polyisoprenoid-binding protein YceI
MIKLKEMKKPEFATGLRTARIALAVIIFLAIPLFVTAHTFIRETTGTERHIKVSGTSTMRDWELNSTYVESQGRFNFDEKGRLRSISFFTFSVVAATLKSDSKIMDKRTHQVLKADEYPRIYYKLHSAVINPVHPNTYLIHTTGALTIAGVTQTINMDVAGVVNNNNTVTCIGLKKIKLTDYKITPPVYMAGAMKVGNELTIDFSLAVKNSPTL